VCCVLFDRGVILCDVCICLLCLIVLPLPPGKNPFAVKINNNYNKFINFSIISSLKYKSPVISQIPAELIQAGGEALCSQVHKFILFQIRKNCLSSGRSLFLYQFTGSVIKLTVVVIEACHCYQLHTTFYPMSAQCRF
jgi:hypothetical protein